MEPQSCQQNPCAGLGNDERRPDRLGQLQLQSRWAFRVPLPGTNPSPLLRSRPSGEDPGCYFLRRPEAPPFLLRLRPLPNPLRIPQGPTRFSTSLGWLECLPALWRAAGDGARRLSGSRRGDVGLTISAAGLLRTVAGGSWLRGAAKCELVERGGLWPGP